MHVPLHEVAARTPRPQDALPHGHAAALHSPYEARDLEFSDGAIHRVPARAQLFGQHVDGRQTLARLPLAGQDSLPNQISELVIPRVLGHAAILAQRTSFWPMTNTLSHNVSR